MKQKCAKCEEEQEEEEEGEGYRRHRRGLLQRARTMQETVEQTRRAEHHHPIPRPRRQRQLQRRADAGAGNKELGEVGEEEDAKAAGASFHEAGQCILAAQRAGAVWRRGAQAAEEMAQEASIMCQATLVATAPAMCTRPQQM